MKCNYCDGELPAGARNCPNCGAACSGNTAPQQQTMQQNTQTQQAPASQAVQPQLSWWGKIWSQPRMARKDFWIIFLILLLLEGVGAGTVVLPIFCTVLEINIAIHRLHDTNNSAWHLLWCLTGIGAIVPLIMAFQAGTEGPNQYGDVPQRIF